MNSKNITRPCIKIINTYLQNNCTPNNIKLNCLIQKIDDVFLKTNPIDRQIFLYKSIDLRYDQNKHKSELFSYKGIYKGYLLTHLYPDPILLNSNKLQQMILRINVSSGSKCILLDDTNVLLDRNSFVSIKSIDKFIININYESLN